MEWVSITTRRLWLRRNEFIFEGKLSNPKQLIQATEVTQTEFSQAQQSSKAQQAQGGVVSNHPLRRKPGEGFVKPNWDAAVDEVGKKIDL